MDIKLKNIILFTAFISYGWYARLYRRSYFYDLHMSDNMVYINFIHLVIISSLLISFIQFYNRWKAMQIIKKIIYCMQNIIYGKITPLTVKQEKNLVFILVLLLVINFFYAVFVLKAFHREGVYIILEMWADEDEDEDD